MNREFAMKTKKMLQIIVGDGNLFPAKYHERIILPTAFLSGTLLVMILSFINFTLNFGGNITETCTALVGCLGGLIQGGAYSHLWFNRERFYTLFDDMEYLITERTNCE